MFTNDLVMTLYTHHLILIAGIVVAVILAKTKFAWLALLAGAVCEFVPIWNDYTLLSRAGYGYAMSGVIGEFVIVALVGVIVVAIVRSRQKNKQLAAKYVIFYCPTCKGTREGSPGDIQGCPVCHKRTMETPVLNKDWIAMTPQQQAAWKQSWDM